MRIIPTTPISREPDTAIDELRRNSGRLLASRALFVVTLSAAVDQGAEVIVWPSATGRGLSLAIFAERLEPESHVEVVRSFDLGRSVLTSVERPS